MWGALIFFNSSFNNNDNNSDNYNCSNNNTNNNNNINDNIKNARDTTFIWLIAKVFKTDNSLSRRSFSELVQSSYVVIQMQELAFYNFMFMYACTSM